MRDFHRPGRSPTISVNGMCASSHPLASKVAIQMLEAGGNAVDAAVAASLVLEICEPQMTGIGGDCFALIKPSQSEDVVAINGSGRAPAAMSSDQLRKRGQSIAVGSADAVTIPGAVDAFCKMVGNWGNLGIAAVLAPAIYYARAGVPVAPRTAFDWASATENLKGRARKDYLLDGQAPACGQVFRLEKLADVLGRIAKDGRDGFYHGEVADDMVSSLNNAGGAHTLDDFAAVNSDYAVPLSSDYRGTTLLEHPPNGQGATALLLAGILSHFDFGSMDPYGTARLHIEAEATKLAYDARNRFIADLDHSDRINHMLSPETAASLARLIRTDKVINITPQFTEAVHKDTVCLSVVDKDRMAVSMIYSIFRSFGSGISSDRFGVLFHNRGAGFTLEPGHPNEAGGGKRPMHTIIPGMLSDGEKVTMAFGVMGGQYQANGHARFLSNMVDFGMDPQTAIDGPRSFAEDGVLKMERGHKDEVLGGLKDLGHKIVIPDLPIGGAQAVGIDHANGTLTGASDSRKDGLALGY